MNFSPHHEPIPPMELQILTHLQSRLHLSNQDKLNYENLYKGYIGEKKFFNVLKEKLSIDCIILNSLLLESNHTTFQLDHILIDQDRIYLFDVKNFEGDFYINNDCWYVASSNKEIRNPLLQLKRSEFLFRNLLPQVGCDLKVESYIIFINKEFMLYQAPLNKHIIYRSQMNRFLRKLNSQSSSLSGKHTKLAKFLIDNHINESPYNKLPNYDFHQLKKGIVCNHCGAFMKKYNRLNLKCMGCNSFERNDASVLRSVKEFHLLFPDKKITLDNIYKWCHILPKKMIGGILRKHFKLIDKARYSYYVYK